MLAIIELTFLLLKPDKVVEECMLDSEQIGFSEHIQRNQINMLNWTLFYMDGVREEREKSSTLLYHDRRRKTGMSFLPNPLVTADPANLPVAHQDQINM
jgi:hypothetical protein